MSSPKLTDGDGRCDEAQRSPPSRARKTRGKYSTRACVQCRKRKLKCSGNEPCHRCSQSNLPCLFSGDPALAAEFLRRSYPVDLPNQGLATPRPPPPQHDHVSPRGRSGGSEIHDVAPDLGERIKKIESTLETLVRLMPQNGNRDSVDPQLPDENDGFQGDTAFKAPVNAFNANLAPLRERLGHQESISPSNHDKRSPHLSSHSTVAESGSAEPLITVRFGSHYLPFPGPAEYLRYRTFFFDDINPCHPCVNEADFNAKCQKLLVTGVINSADACTLALNYIIFACTDILRDTSPAQEKSRLPGWRWYHAADELMRMRKLSGRGDLTLVQYLVYEALYLTYCDKANAAYNAAGLACRLCFQFGLHQQKLWDPNCTPFARHMRQRLFWTVYFLDRRISLSCGRPYGMRDADINVDLPSWIDDKALYPDKPLPETSSENNYNAYLSCMVAFARFAGEIWDQAFSATATDNHDLGEKLAVLDTRISYWLDTTLPSTPLIPQQSTPTARHLWQHSLVRSRMNHLRLLLRRRKMVSLTYSATDGLVSGEVAMDMVRDIHSYAREADKPSSYRFHMAFSLGSAIIILAALLCRDLTTIGLQEHRLAYTESYRLGMSTLQELSVHLCEAGRIMDNLKDIANVVDLVLQHQNPDALENGNFTDLIPANMDDLFPLGAMDYSHMDMTTGDFEPLYVAGDGVGLSGELNTGSIQNYRDSIEGGGDSWDHFELLRTTGEHGVPWV